MHPIFSVLIRRPELVVDHVAGYAALVHKETGSVLGELVRRAAAWGAAALAFGVFLVLAGSAVMLGVMYGEFHWVLVAVPCVALVLAGVALAIASKTMPPGLFSDLKAQLEADAQALRAAKERHER